MGVAQVTEIESGGGNHGARQVDRIDGRYDIREVLGQGGMATVYRVAPPAGGPDLALKQLSVCKDDRYYTETVALFEREFHTLAQLSHPRIIKVYDYGIEDYGSYYTMELLEGADLRELSPLPWRDACRLVYDVCSSLALLHSRRLVHRDVSPSNVRQASAGDARLIDFGAMIPMGSNGIIVGTPAFVAPEVLHRVGVDARADLFSLGATLYFALTGRSPHKATKFADLFAAYLRSPEPPSRIAADIPAALDALVLSLLSIDPTLRPRTAFEVMERLSAVANLDVAEPVDVSRSYLVSPVMVGREHAEDSIRDAMRKALAGHGSGLLVRCASGLGGSRLLDASAIAAKALGFTVLRVGGSVAKTEGFAVAATLTQQLLEADPERTCDLAAEINVLPTLFENRSTPPGMPEERRRQVRDLRRAGRDRVETQTALNRFFLRLADERPLAIAVDDVHRLDEPSLALLAALLSRAGGHPLVVLATVDASAPPADQGAFALLEKHSTAIELSPLARHEVGTLLESLFGDVPNLAKLREHLFRVADGNPRATMDLAQHLVDEGFIRYESGNWTVPLRLDGIDLPATVEDAMRERLAKLSPLSRWIAEALALSLDHAFSREECLALRSAADARTVDAALSELLARQVVVGDGSAIRLAHSGWTALLAAPLDDVALVERHAALADLHEEHAPLHAVHHMLWAGLDERGLELIGKVLSQIGLATDLYRYNLAAVAIGDILERALATARRLDRPKRELCTFFKWLASLSVGSDDVYYFRVASEWLAQLRNDVGLDLWEDDTETTEPGDRLSSAMQRAFARYMETEESVRVYRPDQAIQELVQYTVVSVAIGVRALDPDLIQSLPPLLEPFAPLSPLVDAIHQNLKAAEESMCFAQPERARKRWVRLFATLGEVAGSDLQHVEAVRRAVAVALGSMEAWMGIPTAAEWAEGLDGDALHDITALLLRRIVRLEQGDWEGAEQLRRDADVLSVQAHVRQMFSNLTSVELAVHTMARDLTGLRQCMDRLDAFAAAAPGWAPYQRLAEARFELVRGNFERAAAAFASVLELVAKDVEQRGRVHGTWAGAVAGYVEAKVELGLLEQAQAYGEVAMAHCRRLHIGAPSFEIARPLAIAEARLGHADGAARRLDGVIAAQRELGAAGIHLGATYEARARVAMLAGDEGAFQKYARLTSIEYRHGHGSPLGALYERLMDEARRTAKARADTDRPTPRDLHVTVIRKA